MLVGVPKLISRVRRSSPKGTLAKAWVLADQLRRGHLALVLGLSVLASILETAAAALIVVVLGLSTGEGGISLPGVGDVTGYLPGETLDAKTMWAAIALAVFFLIRACVLVVQTYVQQRIMHRAGARLAVALLHGYLRKPYAFHLQRKTAELTRNTYNGVQTLVLSVLIPVVTLFTDALATVVLLGFMLAVSPIATVLAIGLLLPVILVLLRVIQPRLKKLGRVSQDEAQHAFQLLQHTFVGIREIKLHGSEPFFIRSFSRTRMRAARAQYLKGSSLALPRTVIETVLVLLLLAFVAMSALTGGGGGSTIPVVGLFAYVGFRLQPSLQRIVLALNNIRFAGPAVDDLYSDYITMDRTPSLTAGRAGARPGALSSVSLRSVWFSYSGDEAYALRDIDLTLRKGESIGVCGRSGGGKSTLIDILCGLLAPTRGMVAGEVDGRSIDIADDLATWYSRVGLVSQSIFLFDGTVRDNIAFGVPPRDVDEARLEEAAELAQLGPMVAAHPDGLDAEVGERGLSVSGGQRQRIAIARALYLQPELLVFDEGTSALDNTTEAALVRALDELRADRLTLMVAHRLSTVRRCDRIVYLSQGRISAQGSYDDLIDRHGEFNSMAIQDDR